MKDSRNSLDAGDWPDSPYDDPKAIQREITGVHNWKTQRGLSTRHVQFLALGGCIGTGLFVGSGQALSTVGHGGKQLQKHKLDMGLICDSSFDHGLYCHVKYRILCHENARWNDHLSPPPSRVFLCRISSLDLRSLVLDCYWYVKPVFEDSVTPMLIEIPPGYNYRWLALMSTFE